MEFKRNGYLKNYKLIILVATMFGLLAVYLCHSYLSDKVGLRPVVMVKEDVQAGTALTDERLKVEMLPKGGVNGDVLKNINEAAGKYSKGYIPANTPLRASMIGTGVSGNPLEDLSRYPGRVLLGLDYKVDTTAGYVVRPGALVDVDTITKKEAGGEKKTVISGAPVLYSGGQGSNQSKQSVVIAINQEEKQNYLLARSSGAEFIVTVRGVAE
ncbi:MAG: SAF domain-containing protein [Bacillota bacterium]